MEGKYLFVCYRDWAKNTYKNIEVSMPIATTNDELVTYLYKMKNLKYIFFVGWSEIISENIIKKYDCYCIHPSDLPRYRGGSPLQNQILDNVLDSAVTLFKMNLKLDAGPIYKKYYLSLEGSLADIFSRISVIGSVLINSLIEEIEEGLNIKLNEQDEKLATYRKRRSPAESEIKKEDF